MSETQSDKIKENELRGEKTHTQTSYKWCMKRFSSTYVGTWSFYFRVEIKTFQLPCQWSMSRWVWCGMCFWENSFAFFFFKFQISFVANWFECMISDVLRSTRWLRKSMLHPLTSLASRGKNNVISLDYFFFHAPFINKISRETLVVMSTFLIFQL